jgi:uncharacterized protein YbaR (Trm112 family)
MNMAINYLCPYCNGYLNIDDNIIFATRTPKNNMGIILLHQELGNYSVTKHESFLYEDGDKLEFICPICHKNLTSWTQENLAKVIFEDEKGHIYEVLFSKVAGEKSTYKTIGENMEVYGSDSRKYLDFINLSLMH